MDSLYCKHGVYVGGCGADHMCTWCETDTEPPTIRVHLLRQCEDGQWEELFKPLWLHHWQSLNSVADSVEELNQTGRTYAIAVG